MEYVLNTKVFESGQIEQELHRKNQTDVMARWIVDTRDSDMKKALIAMGWTPPIENKAIIKDLEAVQNFIKKR